MVFIFFFTFLNISLYRYGVNNQFGDVEEFYDEEEFFDEAHNTTEDDSVSNLENVAIPAEPQPNFVTLSRVQNKPILPSVIAMGGRHREAIEENTMEELDEPNFVTLSRVQNKPILPPVVYMGGRLRETIEEETMDYDEDDDEGFVEGTILSQMFSKNARFDKGFVP